jgi:hypothetical protein
MGGKNKQNTLLPNLSLEEINTSAVISSTKTALILPFTRGPDSEL